MSTMHPSDEDLSAYLDGEAPEVAAHVDGCAACRARVERLRGAAAMVATPPPPPHPAARDAAIAAAVARPSRPSRRLVLLAAAAAVVVVAGIATPLLLQGGGTRHTSTALSDSKTASGQATSAFDGGDLGDESDPDALSGLVSRSVTPQDAIAGASGSAAGPGAAAPAATASTILCTPPAGEVVYRARLRWKGAPAQVFGIEPGRRLVVMDSARCQVLVDRHF
ncbi:MAG TPA: hypothetical protein VFA83_05405 [Acidimicrobiales bacterium]|nr:hypothetical protein [Acidimicrobiales bacterium]